MTNAEARTKRNIWRTLARKAMSPILSEALSKLPDTGKETIEIESGFYKFIFSGSKNSFSLKRIGGEWEFFSISGLNSHHIDTIYDVMYSLVRDYDSYTPS
jgi:hypothetical protein